ncbi:MAG TPA: hypothetical protein EYP08_06665 [Pyrodictiaceae archaeon]|nr:hypothetical protein [Pyrodictiaceae archaeon]
MQHFATGHDPWNDAPTTKELSHGLVPHIEACATTVVYNPLSLSVQDVQDLTIIGITSLLILSAHCLQFVCNVIFLILLLGLTIEQKLVLDSKSVETSIKNSIIVINLSIFIPTI